MKKQIGIVSLVLAVALLAQAAPRELTGAQIRNGAGLLTLPTSTDTLVGRATTDTLTNKSIDADDNTISDIDNGEIKAAAGIALNKLATVTASRALESDSSGFITQSSVTSTQMGFLANASANLCGISQICALSNKTLNNTNTITLKDTSFTLQDSGDVTKQAIFDIANVTGGNTRVIAVPDASTTIVGTDVTQTLTNKTLTSPTLTTPGLDIAIFDGQGSTPGNPSAGYYKFYVKDDGKAYTLNSSGTETEIGTGASSNSFETINAPAGTDPVADSTTDTLNITTSDSTIVATGTSGTDTLDFKVGSNLANANIDAAAAIAYSKLNLSGAIVNADVNASAAIAYSKLNLGTSIVNADVSASAAIARTKLGNPAYNGQSADYTLQSSDDVVVFDTSGAARTATLPAAASNTGKIFTIKKGSNANANTVTVDGNSSETIEGSTTYVLVAPNAYVTIQSDGSNWLVIAKWNPWKVDANLAGGNPNIGTSAQTAYVGIENGSLTLTNNASIGGGNIAAQVPCSSTNAPSGTTCSAGNESIGVAFTPPAGWAGDVMACVEFTGDYDNGASGNSQVTYQIVETPTNAQTISAEGRSRKTSGNRNQSSVQTRAEMVCGTFALTGGSQKVLRLFYEQSVSGSINSNLVIGDANTNNGQRDIHWTVVPLN